MPATAKNKRKIHVNGRDFYWKYEIPWEHMTIMTPDKNFVAIYRPDVIYGGYGLFFKGTGQIEITKSNIPELANVKRILDTPDWSNLSGADLHTPAHVRQVIVYIFETLKASD